MCEGSHTSGRCGLGLRCEAMIFLGVLWILFGVGVLTGASDPPEDMIFVRFPQEIRAMAWAGTGIGAIVTGWGSSGTSKALGGLMAMPLLRVVSYLWSYILYLIPGVNPGEYPKAWFWGVMYFALMMLVMFVVHIPPGLLRTGSSPDRERWGKQHDG